MRTEDLIDVLADQLTPVRRQATNVRLVIGVAVGSGVAFLILWRWVGLRQDLSVAILSCEFWIKLAFPLAVMAASFVAVQRLSRPGSQRPTWLFIALPIIVVGAVATFQLLVTPNGERVAIWLGHTAMTCSLGIMALSTLVFCGLIWSFQRLAPTRLALSGFGAGLLAGAASASVYAFACVENSAAFVATWYSLGILGSGVLGAAIGPSLLRW